LNEIAVLTSGGDAPGMNAAIRAVVRVAADRGVRVRGVQEGYEGLIQGRFVDLVQENEGGGLRPLGSVDLAASLGGTLLGSTRSEAFRTEEGRARAAANLKGLAGFGGLVVIGGNGSLTGAHHLASECGIPVVGIPASIDNDIGCTSTAIGVDTALNTIVDACDRISDTARAHRRVFVMEVMGRHCGYLAMASAVAVGADAVLFREQDRGLEEVAGAAAEVVEKALAQGRDKRRVLILLSEGVSIDAPGLVKDLKSRLSADHPGVEIRGIVLGHLVRGGRPSFLDRMIGGRFGLASVEALLSGDDLGNGEMLAWQSHLGQGVKTSDPAITRHPLEDMVEETAALLDGTSPITKRRVRQMKAIEGVLSL
jgi:6-phosphofructokinase 1